VDSTFLNQAVSGSDIDNRYWIQEYEPDEIMVEPDLSGTGRCPDLSTGRGLETTVFG